MPPNGQQPASQPTPQQQQTLPPQAAAQFANSAQQTATTPQDSAQQQAEQTKKSQTNQTTTQKSLIFSELRDSMIIMADGSYRAVIACQSINFDLMSSHEREGVEYSYQNFLNSLNFSIQILVRSQRVDISPYIDKLQGIRRSQDNMLLGVLMDDYIDFIGMLADEANIMDKSFYIVVPFSPSGDASKLVDQGKGFFSKLLGKTGPVVTRIDQAAYEKAKSEIKNRVDAVTSGLYQIGVQCVQLNTKELGELYYNMYNPDTAVNQPLGDFENMTPIYVKKGSGDVLGASLEKQEMD